MTLEQYDHRDREAALTRARTMKACIPDAVVRGFGRVRDIDVTDLALWILKDQNTPAGDSPRPLAGGPGARTERS